jgi:phage/plasmid-associated DNA primase
MFLAGILKTENFYDKFKEYAENFDYEKIWDESKYNRYTIDTLKYLAITSDLKNYVSAFNIFDKNKINNEKSLIDEFLKILKYEFIIDKSHMYSFDGVRWIKINEKNNLNDIISKKIKNISHVLDLVIVFENYINKIDEIIINNSEYIKINLSKQCLIKNFKEIKDERTHIIGFTNGILDLENLCFRDGVPEDHLTLSCGYDYEEYNKDHELYSFLNNYIESLFSNEKSITDLYDLLSKILVGDNKLSSFNVWELSGGEKIVLLNLLKNTFGGYAKFTQGEFLHELDQIFFGGMKGVRILIIDEIEKCNPSSLKELYDKKNGRELFEDPFPLDSQYTCIMSCKNLPSYMHENQSIKRRTNLLKFDKNYDLNKDVKKVFMWSIYDYYKMKYFQNRIIV